MKTCVIVGNCQHRVIENYLKLTDFSKEYQILPTWDIFVKKIDNLDKETLSKVDLFLYQHISKEYDPYFNSEHLLSLLPSHTKKICIPNFYFSGYFPQVGPRNSFLRRFSKTLSPIGKCVYGDKEIEKTLIDDLSLEEAIKKLSDKDFFSKEELLLNVENTITELKKEKKNIILAFQYQILSKIILEKIIM